MALLLRPSFFLAAVVAAALAACATEQVDTKTDPDSGIAGTGGGKSGAGGEAGTSGSAGQPAGTAGEAGSAGSGLAGTAGEAGAAGTGAAGAGGGDAGPACLGDGTAAAPACSALPYAGNTCGDGGAFAALGSDLCAYMVMNGRGEVTQALFDCLALIDPTATDPCSPQHDTKVQECVDEVFAETCETPPVVVDGGVDGGAVDCAGIAMSCPASTGGDGGAIPGISEGACKESLGAFNEAWRGEIVRCYNAATGTCREDFEACVFQL